MVRTVVLHRVTDYAAWREVYNGFADEQAHGGVRAQAVLQSCDDPNEVLVTHDFDDEAAARAFFGWEGLKAAMAQGGVVGEPQLVWFGNVA
jgi:quinol monooxygenase YgiN